MAEDVLFGINEGWISVAIGDTVIHRHYPPDDPIWKLDQEKQQRKMIATVQRQLIELADRLRTKIVERG